MRRGRDEEEKEWTDRLHTERGLGVWHKGGLERRRRWRLRRGLRLSRRVGKGLCDDRRVC